MPDVLGIVESQADPAAITIGEQLRSLVDWRPAGNGYRIEGAELQPVDDLHLDVTQPRELFSQDPELLVFISRHAGDTGPLLTGHFTGNFGPADAGGEDQTVAPPAPTALAQFLESLEAYAPEQYETGIECTHHGPTDLRVPSLFAELGSSEEAWSDPEGAAAVARAVLDIRRVSPHGPRQVVGFGGGHYAPRFERVLRETPWAVGHIGADWALEAMGGPDANRSVLESAVQTSQTDLVLLASDHPDLATCLESWGYRVVSEGWLREVGDRDRELIEAIESDLGSVAESVRLGAHRTTEYTIEALPERLIETAARIDRSVSLSILEDETVAFQTDGEMPGSAAAVPPSWTVEGMAESFLPLLSRRYDTVALEQDTVRVEETVFDPDAAQSRGVPEGPLYGRLADGESVEIDGECIRSDMVHRTRTDRFPLE